MYEKDVCCQPLSLSLFPPLSSALSPHQIVKNSMDYEKIDVYLLLDYGQVTHNLHVPLFLSPLPTYFFKMAGKAGTSSSQGDNHPNVEYLSSKYETYLFINCR